MRNKLDISFLTLTATLLTLGTLQNQAMAASGPVICIEAQTTKLGWNVSRPRGPVQRMMSQMARSLGSRRGRPLPQSGSGSGSGSESPVVEIQQPTKASVVETKPAAAEMPRVPGESVLVHTAPQGEQIWSMQWLNGHSLAVRYEDKKIDHIRQKKIGEMAVVDTRSPGPALQGVNVPDLPSVGDSFYVTSSFDPADRWNLTYHFLDRETGQKVRQDAVGIGLTVHDGLIYLAGVNGPEILRTDKKNLEEINVDTYGFTTNRNIKELRGSVFVEDPLPNVIGVWSPKAGGIVKINLGSSFHLWQNYRRSVGQGAYKALVFEADSMRYLIEISKLQAENDFAAVATPYDRVVDIGRNHVLLQTRNVHTILDLVTGATYEWKGMDDPQLIGDGLYAEHLRYKNIVNVGQIGSSTILHRLDFAKDPSRPPYSIHVIPDTHFLEVVPDIEYGKHITEIYDLRTGQKVWESQERVLALRISPDQKQLAYVDSQGQVHVVNLP